MDYCNRHSYDRYPYDRDYHKKACDCDSNNNNNNNNNIVVPPIIIDGGCDKPDYKKDKKGMKDFVYFTADPQDSTVNEVLMSDDVNDPTRVAQLTVFNIKKGDKVWLNGLFHIDNDQQTFITTDVRIYVNTINPGQEIYRAVIEIDEWFSDDLTQPIPVQDVKYFDEDTNSITYILVVSCMDTVSNDVFLNRPITFTATVIK